MASMNRIKVGQVLYDKRRRKMGNTTMSEDVVWEVKIVEIDPEKKWAVVSWNGNAPRKYFPADIERLRVKEPKVRPNIFQQARAARRT